MNKTMKLVALGAAFLFEQQLLVIIRCMQIRHGLTWWIRRNWTNDDA